MIENSPILIESKKFLKFNPKTYFAYQVFCIISFGLIFLFFRWLKKLHLFYYDEVIEMNEATHIWLYFFNEDMEIL